jgi:hypothetical protein
MSRVFLLLAVSGVMLGCGDASDGNDAAVAEERPNHARTDGGAQPPVATEGPSDAAVVTADSAPARREPLPVVLPPGTSAPELKVERVSSMAVDLSGTLWVVSQCQGVYALAEGELQHYGWVDTALPERVNSVVVDGLNRKWFRDYRSIGLLDGTHWSEVAEGDFVGGFSVAADGSAWVEDLATGTLSNVAPGLEYELSLPERPSSFAAVGARALWVTFGDEVRYFDDGAWSEPVAVGGGWGIQYDAAHDVAWLESNEPALLRWADGQIDVDPIPEFPIGWFSGFDGQGRMVRASDTAVNWIGTSGVEETSPLSQFADTPYSTLDFDGKVLLVERDYSPPAIFRLEPGGLRRAQRITAFEPEVDYAWRAAGYRAALRASPVEANAEQFGLPDPELIGEKVHLVGYLESGFESSGVNLDGASFPYWVEVARDFWNFVGEEGWSLFVDVDAPTYEATVEVEEWDLFGYIEVGACFGHEGASARQFWVVEAYPRAMPEAERTTVRARLLAAAAD